MKWIILLEFKRTSDTSETYYYDMKVVTVTQHTESLKTFGMSTGDGKQIIYRLVGTLLSEHEKLCGIYWRQVW
jgi:hypothetical protein